MKTMCKSKNAINIAKDFSKYPGGRYHTDGPYSGEKFREEILAPSLDNNEIVTIDLDGALGYGSSFLEEAFGGLVRLGYFSRERVKSALRLISSDPVTPLEINEYIDDAQIDEEEIEDFKKQGRYRTWMTTN